MSSTISSFFRRSLGRGVAAFVALAFLVPCYPVGAGQKDDLYLEAFQLIQQGDMLLKEGERQAALRKYQKAEAALQTFRAEYPDYGQKMVGFRLSYVAEKIAACAEKPAAEASGQGQAAARPAAAAGAVKLLEAGAEPKAVLRLHPKEGDQQHVELELKMGMEMQMGGMGNQSANLPVIKMPLDLTVNGVSPEGDITYETVMGEPAVSTEGASGAVDVNVMKAALGSVKGLTGTGTITSSGVLKSSNVKMVAGADASARQAMEQMKDSFSEMTTAFPEEAVGPGAKWEVTRPVKSQGMILNQTTTYELVSVDGDHVTLKSSFVQTASNQKIQNPAMAGMKLDLVKMTGRGTGDLQLDLTKLMPSEASTDSRSEFAMALNAGGQKQTMNMKLGLNVKLATK